MGALAGNGSKRGAISPSSPFSPRSSRGSCSPGSPYAGYHFLRLAHSLHISGEKNAVKAMQYALKAVEFFEGMTTADVRLELVTSLQLLAATTCKLRQYEEAIPILKRSLAIYSPEMDSQHAFEAFAGHMQLGDTYTLLGRYENALNSYHGGLKIQKQVLGEMDYRVAETCHYIAESHLQALQFREALELCEHALSIHMEHGGPGSEEEISDRRLMALILAGKGNHEAALENLVLARLGLSAKGKELEVASIDSTIGDTYLAQGRYDEAAIAYQKALPVFRRVHGEDHTRVAALFVSLAQLHLKMAKTRVARSYCENALRIYGRQGADHSPAEIATGLTEVAALFECMDEHEHALSLFQRALDIVEEIPGQQSEVAGIEAQIGVLFHMVGKYEEAYMAFKSAVYKLRCGSQKKTWFLGTVLNQMGLACVALNAIWDAAELFEEAKSILVEVCGLRHADSLAVSSNLAGAYDALGRLDDAIQLLEEVLEVKEKRLGTLHPDVEQERHRLKELLNEAGRSQSRKSITLQDHLFS